MSRLWIRDILPYLRTRLPARIYFPVALFLYTASVTAGRSLDGPSLILGLVLTYTLVFQFRLWDDLSSRAQDQLVDPDRVLSKTPSVLPFYALFMLAFAFNGVVIFLETYTPLKLVIFLALNGALFYWYGRQKRAPVSRLVNAHLILVKYPLFIYLLSGSSAARKHALFLSMLVVYLCFCVYELLHDRRLWVLPGLYPLLASEMAALVITSAFMTYELADRGLLPTLSHASLTAVAASALMSLFVRHRSTMAFTRRNYVVFVIGFLQLLNFSFGGGM